MNNKPYMTALLDQVGKQVEHIDAVFTTLAKMSDSVPFTESKEFLKIHKRYYRQDEIGVAFMGQENKSQPIADIIEYRGDDYTYRGKAHLSAEDWFDTGTHDFNISNKLTTEGRWNYFETCSDEERNQINNGMMLVDVQYSECDSYGFLLMTGKGLKALEKSDPILYRAMTSLIDGNLHWKHYGKEMFEIAEMHEVTVTKDDGTLETTVTENYYYWNFRHNQEGMQLVGGKHYDPDTKTRSEPMWNEKPNYDSSYPEEMFPPLENALMKIRANNLV